GRRRGSGLRRRAPRHHLRSRWRGRSRPAERRPLRDRGRRDGLGQGDLGPPADARRHRARQRRPGVADRRLRGQLGDLRRPSAPHRSHRSDHRPERRAMKSRSHFGPARQRGLSLVTTLVLMLATLGLGVAVMSVGAMEERLIANTKDRDLALQAAEAALRDGEQDIATNVSSSTAFSDTCANGLCTPPSQRDTAGSLGSSPVDDAQLGFDWSVGANVRTYGQYTGAAAFPGVAQQPRYVIEKFSYLGTPAGESL